MIIKIKNLQVDCNIGIYQWEKNFNRKLNINIEIEVMNEKSLSSERIEDTVDYEKIYNNIKKIIAEKKYDLIENLANDILQMICEMELVSFARVEIDKMKIFEDVYSCSVMLEKRVNG